MKNLKNLVGASVEWRLASNDDGSSEQVIKLTRRKIAEELERYKDAPSELQIALLGELHNYYKNQPYYAVIKSCIKFGRLASLVSEYLEKSVSEREDYIVTLLSSRSSTYRDVKVAITSYFVKVYARRKDKILPLLTIKERQLCIMC